MPVSYTHLVCPPAKIIVSIFTVWHSFASFLPLVQDMSEYREMLAKIQ